MLYYHSTAQKGTWTPLKPTPETGLKPFYVPEEILQVYFKGHMTLKKMYTLPQDLAEAGNHYLPRHFTVLRSVRTAGLPVTQPMPLLLQRETRLGLTETVGPASPDPLGLGHELVSESESKRTGREI